MKSKELGLKPNSQKHLTSFSREPYLFCVCCFVLIDSLAIFYLCVNCAKKLPMLRSEDQGIRLKAKFPKTDSCVCLFIRLFVCLFIRLFVS